MTIKSITYALQQTLSQIGTPVKRSHVYELLSAAFGYKSYAAFASEAIIASLDHEIATEKMDAARVNLRCADLGYPESTAQAIALQLANLIHDQRLSSITLTDLISYLRGYSDFSDGRLPWDYDLYGPSLPPAILDGLESSASAGNAQAHYALALSLDDENDDQSGVGSDYWYSQMKSGRELSGVEREWALAYESKLKSKEKLRHHLQEAGRLGCDLALLDLAEKCGDPSFFDLPPRRDIDADPIEVARIAKEYGREDAAALWMTIAAESGNTEAMRELIEESEDDLLQCWTWIYLSKLIGDDLTVDRHYAIHEDGSPYDDDVGGHVEVAGEDGVNLPSLPEEADRIARKRAEVLYRHIEIDDRETQ